MDAQSLHEAIGTAGGGAGTINGTRIFNSNGVQKPCYPICFTVKLCNLLLCLTKYLSATKEIATEYQLA